MTSRKAFLQSPHHAALALATLGLGFASGEPLFLIIGFAAYVLGWVYLPDLPLFQNWHENRAGAAEKAAAGEELEQFQARRNKLLTSLTPSRRSRYEELVRVCRDIEQAAADGDDDPRLRRLEELMWTFLRLLTIEESLGEFLEAEARENVPELIAEATAQVARLESESAAARSAGGICRRQMSGCWSPVVNDSKRSASAASGSKKRAGISSSSSRSRSDSEQQIKLIRADSIATKNASALTARIDATVEHLEQTNHWLAQMDQFKDLVSDVPQTQVRVGFGQSLTPPPLPPEVRRRGRERS
jgi:hypothetical protein